MANILVNASAAKHGGARAILMKYISTLEMGGDNYIIICPNSAEVKGAEAVCQFVDFETGGWRTFLFSVFGIYYYCFKYRADVVVSFNNVNCYYGRRTVTYFHQEKALHEVGLRFFLIRLGVRLCSKGYFIVQSERIKRSFLNCFGFDQNKVVVKWPGVRQVALAKSSEPLIDLQVGFQLNSLLKIPDKIAFLPVYEPNSSHKDYVFFKQLKSILRAKGYVTVSLCPPGSGVADYDVGKVSARGMDFLYSISDVMLVVSIKETLCLPIFEYAQTGKPILCREADYIIDFKVRYADWLMSLTVLPIDFSSSEVADGIALRFPPLIASQINSLCTGDWDLLGLLDLSSN